MAGDVDPTLSVTGGFASANPAMRVIPITHAPKFVSYTPLSHAYAEYYRVLCFNGSVSLDMIRDVKSVRIQACIVNGFAKWDGECLRPLTRTNSPATGC